MALLNALLGMTLAARNANNRSKIMASAKTEQMIRGQMGQPAACMMLNKSIFLLLDSVLIMAEGIVRQFCG
jgi:hypothetical protein